MSDFDYKQCPLGPQAGPAVGLRRAGKIWLVGNHPARLALEIADNDNGETSVVEIDCRTGEAVLAEAAE